jgi:hypothetical protein
MTPRKPKLPVEERGLAGGAEPKTADSLNGTQDPVLTVDPAAERHPTNVPELKVEQPQAKLDPPIPAEDAQSSPASVVEVSPSPTPSGGDTPEPRPVSEATAATEGARAEEKPPAAEAQPGAEPMSGDAGAKPEQVRKGRRRPKVVKS